MSDLTPEALDEFDRLHQDATPGGWIAVVRDDGRAWIDMPGIDGHAFALHGFGPDAALIAAMRNALPALIAADRERREASRIAFTVISERDALARWKAEALPVMSGLQELGRALGVTPGKQITARESVDLALDLRNRATTAEAERDALAEKLTAVEALADELDAYAQSRSGGRRNDLDAAADAARRVIAGRLRALAGPSSPHTKDRP